MKAQKIAKRLALSATAGAYCARIVLAIGTFVFVFPAARTMFLQHFASDIIVTALSLIATVLAVTLLDGGFAKTAPYVVAWVVAKLQKKELHDVPNSSRKLMNTLHIIVFSLFVLQGSMTLLTNIVVSPDVAEYSVDKPEFNKYGEVITQVSKSSAQRIETMTKEVSIAEHALIAEQERKKMLINEAIESKGIELARQYRSGNAWAETQLRQRIAKATKDGDAAIAQARKDLKLATKRLSSFVEKEGNNTSRQISAVEKGANEATMLATSKITTRSILLRAIMIFSFLLLIGCLFVIASYESLYNEDLGGNDNIGAVLSRALSNAAAVVTEYVARLLGANTVVRFTLDEHIDVHGGVGSGVPALAKSSAAHSGGGGAAAALPPEHAMLRDRIAQMELERQARKREHEQREREQRESENESEKARTRAISDKNAAIKEEHAVGEDEDDVIEYPASADEKEQAILHKRFVDRIRAYMKHYRRTKEESTRIKNKQRIEACAAAMRKAGYVVVLDYHEGGVRISKPGTRTEISTGDSVTFEWTPGQ